MYRYDAYNYLVLSVPLPFECETVEAGPEKPLLGMVVKVTPSSLGESLLEMDESISATEQVPQGIYSTPLPDELSSAAILILVGAKGCPMNKREVTLGLAVASKTQPHVPAAFFLHFPEAFRSGPAAVAGWIAISLSSLFGITSKNTVFLPGSYTFHLPKTDRSSPKTPARRQSSEGDRRCCEEQYFGPPDCCCVRS